MNWYKLIKISQFSGEYWIDDSGNAIYADGDVGEYNHETYVQSTILSQHGLGENEGFDISDPSFIENFIDNNWSAVVEFINQEGRVDNFSREEALNNPDQYREIAIYNLDNEDVFLISGMSAEEAKMASGRGDARQYAMQFWGWKRLAGQNIETFSLTRGDLGKIANGLYDAYGEDVAKASFNIYVDSNRKWFQNIPYSYIDSGSIKDIKDKAFVGW